MNAEDLPTRPSTTSDEDLLVELVEQGLAATERGTAPDLEAICAAHPHLRTAVAEALGLEDAVPGSARDANPLEGKVLAERYRIGVCVGLGAMGSVHRARDEKLERDVAVKVMHPGLFPDRQRQERFVREAKVLAALQHPAIVPIHDHGETPDGTFYFVMDLLDGVSLAEVLRHAAEGEVPLHAEAWATDLGIAVTERTRMRQIVRWTAQLADALAVAHHAGVVHRDLKPSNVFITRDGRAVLLDFGIAVRAGDSSLTAADTTLGTPWYMAPEQAGRGDTARAAVDIYGLGASLYHLLTHAPPFQGEPMEVLVKLQTSDPLPPQRLAPELPRDLAAIVEHAIERRPDARYASMGEFAADLRAFLDHRPVRARPIGPLQRAWRRVARRPAVAGALLVAVVAVVAAILYVPFALAAAAADQARYEELRATVPALVCLEGYPDKRLAEDMTESAASLATLTALLELRPDDLASRMMRAALHLDRGDRAACLADFRALQAAQDSPYTRALLEVYESAKDSRRGAAALDLADLPPPASAFDWFVAGFHSLRRRASGDYRRAHEQLGKAASLQPARDLRLLSGLILGLLSRDPAERTALLETAHDEALKLEGEDGRPTARTRHVIGASLVGRKLYGKAEAPLLESLRLRPERHGPLNNLGIVYRRRGELDKAEEFLRRAHALRPWLWNTISELANVQCARKRFDAALELANQVPETGSMGEAWRRPLLIARIRHREAVARMGGDSAAMVAAAEAALVAYRESVANGCKEPLAKAEMDVVQLLAESRGTHEHLLFHTINLWQKDLTNPVMVQNLEVLLRRKSLSELQIAMVRLYLLRLAKEQAPGDPDVDARIAGLEAELQKLLK